MDGFYRGLKGGICSLLFSATLSFLYPALGLTNTVSVMSLAQGQVKKAYDLYISPTGEYYLVFAREATKPFAGASYRWKIVLAKWDKKGTKLWERPIGDYYGMDNRFSLFSDRPQEIFIRGVIEDRFFLWKWGSDGQPLWKIERKSAFSLPEGIAVGDGSGGAYVAIPPLLLASAGIKNAGPIEIAHYSASGKWIENIPLYSEKSPSISWLPPGLQTLDTLVGLLALSSDSLIVYGYTAGFGPLAGNAGHHMDYGWLSSPLIVSHNHIFARKYDRRGKLLENILLSGNWNNLVASAFAGPSGILTLCGTSESFSCPDDSHRTANDLYSLQTFVFRYSAQGRLLWCRQFGSGVSLAPLAITTDSAGGSYVLGEIKDVYPQEVVGEKKPGRVFLARLNDRGDLLWIKQFGAMTSSPFSNIAIDERGAVCFGLKTPRFDSLGPLEEVVVMRLAPGT
ncbi:hypothetical protein EM20IM_04160 [Candidatus Methylacidiphilum infernorum]|uniref:Uncharacterized protein n=1 Tax=Candidatus Methylacidiphilum infernorum TaxID=511746 RepID=A0ABX7PXS5_9BACT|nr:hypothetical protein [Candidatus Methylacidiphilum infernorum]QSR87523.1 hypothetical protein EM20IM_04160 [Candidatus Methylacidiphilum infernorum]